MSAFGLGQIVLSDDDGKTGAAATAGNRVWLPFHHAPEHSRTAVSPLLPMLMPAPAFLQSCSTS
jgi:hypothetical protein